MKTTTPDGRFTISTIPARGARVRLAETCVFQNTGSRRSYVVATYDTFADALADHLRIVADVENIFSQWEAYYCD